MTTIADAPDNATVEQLVQIIVDLEATVEDLQETVRQQADQINDLETELKNQSNNVCGAFTKIGQIDDRLTELETQQTQINDGSADNENKDSRDSNQDQTPLETICALPEHLATRDLSANQDRARFIARDIRDYAKKVPAGLLVDSSTIKKVLTAAEGSKPHTQTVARVMDFLDNLGKDGVKLKKRRGRKLVVFDPEVADRLANHGRCDRGSADTHASNVIGSA